MDLALTSVEQLEQLLSALANEPLLSTVPLDEQMKHELATKRVA